MTKDFISQYLLARSGTQVPRRYTQWGALTLLEMAVGRKVFYNMDHFDISPEWHTCFIGGQGSGKSLGKDQAESMFISALPERSLGPSITSREQIIKYMASELPRLAFIDWQGNEQLWTPISYFIDEFTNWLSFNPKGMIEFLTAIFGKPQFVSETLIRGKEIIPAPYLIILACTTPENFARYLKSDVIGGGFSRRMIPVYEATMPVRVTKPFKSDDAKRAEEWCIAHLRKIDKLAGQFVWESEETFLWFDEWNKSIKIVEENVLSGYHYSKDILTYKLAMCIAMSKEEPKFVFTRENLETARAFLLSNEDNFQKLIAPTGRNELMVPQSNLMNVLEARGGVMSEPEFHTLALRNMYEQEYISMKQSLIRTDQIKEDVRNRLVMTWAKWEELKKLSERPQPDGSLPPAP